MAKIGLTPSELGCRAVENAMAEYRLSQHSLSQAIGCADSRIRKLLNQETVQLNIEQLVNLLLFGGYDIVERRNKHG